MILLSIAGLPAALEDLIWVVDDQVLLEALNEDAANFQLYDMTTSDPDPDLTHANDMIDKWGGKILKYEAPPDLGDRTY